MTKMNRQLLATCIPRSSLQLVCLFVLAGWIIYGIHRVSQSNIVRANIVFTPLCEIKTASETFDAFLVKPFRNQTPWDRLPNLTQIQWPQNLTATLPVGRRRFGQLIRPSEPPFFNPIMSRGQRNVYYTLLRVFAQLMDEHGYSDRYFLTGGTLLGSHRHHDFIPWDDDVDVLVDTTLRPWLRSALRSMGPAYRVVLDDRDRLFTEPLPVDQDNEVDVEKSRQSTSYPWAWPFLDISYYAVNQTHVTEVVPFSGIYYSWPRDVVFPLLYRPFGSNWYPAPKNPLEFLVVLYGRSEYCASNNWSHVFEHSTQGTKTSCRALGARYHFVQHRPCLVNGSVVQLGSNMLVEERLVRRLPDGHEDVVHALCLASDKQTARADTYALDLVQ